MKTHSNLLAALILSVPLMACSEKSEAENTSTALENIPVMTEAMQQAQDTNSEQSSMFYETFLAANTDMQESTGSMDGAPTDNDESLSTEEIQQECMTAATENEIPEEEREAFVAECVAENSIDEETMEAAASDTESK